MKYQKNKSDSAMVLVLCVWLLVIMIVVVMGIVQASKVNIYISSAESAKVRAKWAAHAGVYFAVNEILQSPTGFHDSINILSSLENVVNHKVSNDGVFSLIHEIGDTGKIEYGIIDESSKLNLLTATNDQIANLAKINISSVNEAFRFLDIDRSSGSMSDKTISSIFESNYFAKNINVIARESLLSMKECYGEDTNINQRLDWNENDGELISPKDNSDGILESGLLHDSTLYSYEINIDREGEERVDINNADIPFLADSLQISESEAMWIVENGPYESIAELFPDTIAASDFANSLQTDVNATVQINANVTATDSDGNDILLAIRPSIQTVRRIYDKITVSDQPRIPGKLNINTASADIIAAFFGITDEQAETIVKKRKSIPQGFYTPAEVFSAGVLTYDQFFELAERITVQGNVYTIISVGSIPGSDCQYTVEATVDISNSTPNYLYWKQY